MDHLEHAAVRDRLSARPDAFFARYADPQYDLRRRGGSKTLLLTSRQEPLR